MIFDSRHAKMARLAQSMTATMTLGMSGAIKPS
jgi:hypothetical protein